jgi:hypothetical protein
MTYPSQKRTLTEPARALPVLYEPDVLVVGAGAAGIAAAVSAARAGAKTLLVERYGFVGGTLSAVTLGSICGPFAVTPDALIPMVGGVYSEVIERLAHLDAVMPPRRWLKTATVPYDPTALRWVGDELLASAGVDILLHTLVVDTQCDGRQLTAVIIENKAGRAAITPRIVIDCSGDGDVAARAGARYAIGDAGITQFASTMFRLVNVDTAALEHLSRPQITALLDQAVSDGYDVPRTSVGLHLNPIDGVLHVNATKIKRDDGTPFDYLDPSDLTRAEQEGRRQAYLYEEVLRRYVPGLGKARIIDIGAQLGLRETRLIQGESVLTRDDVVGCVKPRDAIALCAWPLELHSAGRTTQWGWLPEGDYYGVPYGCLVVQGYSNLLVAGRNLSATHEAQSSIRVAAPCFALGQAAGTAAALALARGVNTTTLDAMALREHLTHHGAILSPHTEGSA